VELGLTLRKSGQTEDVREQDAEENIWTLWEVVGGWKKLHYEKWSMWHVQEQTGLGGKI
jgi:hypothetical protein